SHWSGWSRRQWSRTYGSVSREKVRSTEERRRAGAVGAGVAGGVAGVVLAGGVGRGAADCHEATMRRADSVASWRATPSSARTGGRPAREASMAGPSLPVILGADPLRRTRGVPRSRRTVVREEVVAVVAGAASRSHRMARPSVHRAAATRRSWARPDRDATLAETARKRWPARVSSTKPGR